MNLNNVTLAGRLTKDPELRYTPTGVAVATLTVAVNRPFKNNNNEREADFIPCVAWRGLGETIANHFKKGDEFGGTGRIQTRSFENQEGKRVYVTEIVLSDMSFGQKAGGNTSSNTNTAGSQQNSNTGQNGASNGRSNPFDNNDPFANDGKPIDISDDDLPF